MSLWSREIRIIEVIAKWPNLSVGFERRKTVVRNVRVYLRGKGPSLIDNIQDEILDCIKNMMKIRRNITKVIFNSPQEGRGV